MADFQTPQQHQVPKRRHLCLILAGIGSLFILSLLIFVDPHASDHATLFNPHVVYHHQTKGFLKADRVERHGVTSRTRLQHVQNWWQSNGVQAFHDELNCEDGRLFFWKEQICWTCQAPARCLPFSSSICSVSMQMRCNGTQRTNLYISGLELQTNEKNWMPFEGLDGELFMVYSVTPFFTIVQCDPSFVGPTCEVIFRQLNSGYKDIRGGSAGLQISKGHHIFMGHVKTEQHGYLAVLIEIEEGPMKTFKLTRLTAPFSLMHVDGFVYPHGIGFADAEHQNVLISMGVNDSERWVALVSLKEMLKNDESGFRAAIRATARPLVPRL